MLPIYLVIGLLQIFAKHNNYNIKHEDLNMDIRVKRNINEIEKPMLQIPYVLKKIREKRYSAYPDTIPRYNYTNYNDTSTNQGKQNHESSNFFNKSWNYLFNKTKRYFNGNSVKTNGTRVTSEHRNNAYIRSYPYGYPTGYGPKNTTGYKNTESKPYFYNYQNPNGRNFGGYYGINGSRPGPHNQNFTSSYNSFTKVNSSYAAGYVPSPGNFNGQATNTTEYPYSPYRSSYNLPLPVDNPGSYMPSLPATQVTTPGYHPGNYSIPLYNPGNYSLTLPRYNYSIPFPVFNPGNYSSPLSGNNPVTEIPGYTTSTDLTVLGCVICNIPCPAFFRRFGKLCVPNNNDDDYD